jgi:hypothetical protein
MVAKKIMNSRNGDYAANALSSTTLKEFKYEE